jgi:hypothetical protein
MLTQPAQSLIYGCFREFEIYLKAFACFGWGDIQKLSSGDHAKGQLQDQ